MEPIAGHYWRASNIPAYREATGKLCEMHVRAKEFQPAWQDYEDFLNAGGERISPRCLAWTSAACQSNSRTLNASSASTRNSPPPILPSGSRLGADSAARICLKRLSRPLDALRFYEGASASAVPHLDLEQDIELGIHEARTMLPQAKAFSAGAPDAV